MSLIDEARKLRKNWQALLPANDNTNVINAEELCDEWVAGSMEAAVHYEANMCYRYKGQVYRCIQTHDNHAKKGLSLMMPHLCSLLLTQRIKQILNLSCSLPEHTMFI